MSFQVVPLSDMEENPGTQIPETQNFDKFTTEDWMEGGKDQLRSETSDRYFSSSYQKYGHTLWKRGRQLITLTAIAVLLGFIAGCIQILTETLVNWKSGRCSRNWVLNKSFCCANIPKAGQKLLTKRDELKCIDDGLWHEWSNPLFGFFLFVILSLTFAMSSALMVKYIAPMATGSGISEIKVWVSGFRYKDEFLNLTTLIVKSIALPFAISSGLSVGKEGPSVHYATCCGFVITNWLLKHDLKFPEQAEYLIASTAGGVAVAFGAPIGGVLFALEEMSTTTEFSLSILWKSYYVALAAVATLQYMNPLRNGKIVVFEVSYDKDWHVQEIPVFIILGVFGGLYGNFISKWNVHFVSFRRKYLSKWRLNEVAVLALITALLSYFNEFLKLDMTESMGVLFHECIAGDGESVWTHRICQLDANTHVGAFIQILMSLLFATVARALLVVVSYGCSVPAGIFVPSMAVGATFGRAVSLIVERFFIGHNIITPGTYAFLGAAATLSGITNLTLTVVVIMFELTGAFTYIIPTMIVVAITRLIFSSLGARGGIADQMIIFNGFPLLEDSKEDMVFLRNYSALDIMATNISVLRSSMHLSELNDFLVHNSNFNGFPVVREMEKNALESECIGYISKSTIQTQLLIEASEDTSDQTIIHFDAQNVHRNGLQPNELNFSDLVDTSPVTVKPSMPLSILIRMFQKLGCKTILVEQKGILQGLITKKDLLKFQRLKHREIYGPLYVFNESWDDRLGAFLQKISNKNYVF
ncbi:LAFE_0F11980g1_1 [Lachancea fermentati]|uniref:Chloride channel protein n=1 Tax=Lachancea fermentati TaxID=4955 RepID=A0A1G4MFY8_LACFM|nr:LAFE_0F11980g1_1 [Lachancea fermentati]